MTFSLPDEIADVLREQPNASAYVTRAVRELHGRRMLDEALLAVGIAPAQITATAKTAARARVAQAASADGSAFDAWLSGIVDA